jgi:hypothetical protein
MPRSGRVRAVVLALLWTLGALEMAVPSAVA